MIMTTSDEARRKIGGPEVDRRGAIECMIWAGTGVLWTLSGGVPKSLGLLGDALAAEASAFTFAHISDSHIGFNKVANPDALGTLREAIGKIKELKTHPAFMIHTGDITHLSKPDEFDNADQLIGEAKLDVHYVPGEHDVIDGAERPHSPDRAEGRRQYDLPHRTLDRLPAARARTDDRARRATPLVARDCECRSADRR